MISKLNNAPRAKEHMQEWHSIRLGYKMAQIFISHSQEDKDLRSFFADVFAGTHVKAVFEEFEKIVKGTVTKDDVGRDIENSRAVFVILSQNVERITHTRDWVVCETGVAKNKDVWVFEPYSQSGKISVITPFLRDYVVYDINDDWSGYIRRIVESYDDSQTLPTALVGGGLGALVGSELADDREEGAFWGLIGGAIVGAVISDKSKGRPIGLRIECENCHSVYNIHVPQGIKMIRCPVCNRSLERKL